MHRQLKQTALPCRLSGEHIRGHYSPMCHQRPRADVDGRVGVCVRGVAAGNAGEGGLIGAVLLVDAPACSALPRGVTRIDKADRHPGTLRLVGEERAELSEAPVSQSCALVAPGRYPSADALQLFESNTAFGAFSFQHDSLGDAVVSVALIPRLLAGDDAQPTLRSLGSTLLQAGAPFLNAAPPTLDVRPGMRGAVAVRDAVAISACLGIKP